jgi:hypothetical protein
MTRSGCIQSLDRTARQERIESETKAQLVDEHGLDESIASDVAGPVAESSYDLSENLEEVADHISNAPDIDRSGSKNKINEIGQRKYNRLNDFEGVGDTLESRMHKAGYTINSSPTAEELQEDIGGLGEIKSENIANQLEEINIGSDIEATQESERQHENEPRNVENYRDHEFGVGEVRQEDLPPRNKNENRTPQETYQTDEGSTTTPDTSRGDEPRSDGQTEGEQVSNQPDASTSGPTPPKPSETNQTDTTDRNTPEVESDGGK